MNLQDLDKIKAVQLEIMDEIHRICRENSVDYYLICGSFLGAVRHKGFIPWDVDIDIAMPRKDYIRFKQLCESELSDKFRYCDHTVIKTYHQPHALICKKNTNVYTKYDKINPIIKNYGIYVDVFPLDNAPDDEMLREKQAKKLLKIRKFKEQRIPYSYSENKLKRYAHYIRSALLSFVSVRKINQKQQDEMTRYHNENTECICSMASGYKYSKQCMPKALYGTPTLYEFEDRQFFGPEKADEYLTRIYGDYMKLPPEEKRQVTLNLFVEVEIND